MTGSAPRHLAVRADGLVACPDGVARSFTDCYGCTALQGTLEGTDLVMLCGHGLAAPALRLTAVRMQHGAPDPRRAVAIKR